MKEIVSRSLKNPCVRNGLSLTFTVNFKKISILVAEITCIYYKNGKGDKIKAQTTTVYLWPIGRRRVF